MSDIDWTQVYAAAKPQGCPESLAHASALDAVVAAASAAGAAEERDACAGIVARELKYIVQKHVVDILVSAIRSRSCAPEQERASVADHDCKQQDTAETKQKTLTVSQLDALAKAVEGFVGEDWEQGDEQWDSFAEWGDGKVLVLAGDPLQVIFDCGNHDCGVEMAAAMVAMHNALPALLGMARKQVAK